MILLAIYNQQTFCPWNLKSAGSAAVSTAAPIAAVTALAHLGQNQLNQYLELPNSACDLLLPAAAATLTVSKLIHGKLDVRRNHLTQFGVLAAVGSLGMTGYKIWNKKQITIKDIQYIRATTPINQEDRAATPINQEDRAATPINREE